MGIVHARCHVGVAVQGEDPAGVEELEGAVAEVAGWGVELFLGGVEGDGLAGQARLVEVPEAGPVGGQVEGGVIGPGG